MMRNPGQALEEERIPMSFDDMLRHEFKGEHEGTAVTTETEPGRSGFQRYRTGALVGAGSLACAVAGALLGGLGGYFSIAPAPAHAEAAPTINQDLPLARAANAVGRSVLSGATGSSAVTAADISKALGSLTNGGAPFTSLTSEHLPVSSGLPGLGGSSTGKSGGVGGGAGGGLTGCTSGSISLDLTCILSNLSGAPGNLGSLTAAGNSGTLLSGLVPTLTGVAAAGGSPLSGLPVPTGGTSGTGPSIPSLPLPTTIPSLPSGAVSGTSSTTTTTTSSGSSSGNSSSAVDAPLPASVPVTTPTITIGGLSAGVSGSGSKSGLTLTLP
jgi:hypothetical protein